MSDGDLYEELRQIVDGEDVEPARLEAAAGRLNEWLYGMIRGDPYTRDGSHLLREYAKGHPIERRFCRLLSSRGVPLEKPLAELVVISLGYDD